MIDPLYQRVEAYALDASKSYKSIATVEGKIASRAVPGFFVRPEWLWQERLPKVPSVLGELLAPFKTA